MSSKGLSQWQRSAARYLTGGMSSSFRANQFTGEPMYAVSAGGPRFRDVTGKEYIDFFMCHGAVLLGHDQPAVKQAVIQSLEKGFYAGLDSEDTIEFARKVCEAVPAAEQIRFVNSGSEGTLLALRLARGHSGRDLIVRIDGHFHGGHDYLLANNLAAKVDYDNEGRGFSRVIGRTAGVPELLDSLAVTVPWNNLGVLEKALREHGDRIAGIIMNVIDYNNGCFLTSVDYLSGVRDLADKHNVVLIFDEVLSGFKTGLSCGQGYYGVTPDICVLGKALTNDVPLCVVAGSTKIMQKIMDPVDPVIAGGTFSGNQLGIAAGNAVLEILAQPDFYPTFLHRARTFYEQLQSLIDSYSFPAWVQGLGAGFHVFVGTREPVLSYADLARVDREMTKRFFRTCIEKGLYFHTDFTVSAAHDEATLGAALERFEDVITSVLSSAV